MQQPQGLKPINALGRRLACAIPSSNSAKQQMEQVAAENVRHVAQGLKALSCVRLVRARHSPSTHSPSPLHSTTHSSPPVPPSTIPAPFTTHHPSHHSPSIPSSSHHPFFTTPTLFIIYHPSPIPSSPHTAQPTIRHPSTTIHLHSPSMACTPPFWPPIHPATTASVPCNMCSSTLLHGVCLTVGCAYLLASPGRGQ